MTDEIDALRQVAPFFQTEGWAFISRSLEHEVAIAIEDLIFDDDDDDRKRGRIKALRDVLKMPEQVQERIAELEQEEAE